jgi:ABC-2 type transport system permease protein
MIIVTAAVAFISAFATNYSFEAIESMISSETVSDIDEESEEDPENAISVGLTAEVNELDTLLGGTEISFTEYFNYDFSSLILLLFCAIFPPIFVNAEQKHGFIKNIAGQMPNRGMLVVSKLCAVAIQVLTIFVVYMIVSPISCGVLFGDRFVFDFSDEFIKLFGIHFLLHYAFAVLVTAATILLRGSALSMTLGIIVSAGVTSFIYSFTDILLHKIGVGKDFRIGNYALESCISSISTDISGGDLVRVILVGIGFLAVSVAVSMAAMCKRDVK